MTSTCQGLPRFVPWPTGSTYKQACDVYVAYTFHHYVAQSVVGFDDHGNSIRQPKQLRALVEKLLPFKSLYLLVNASFSKARVVSLQANKDS